MKTSRGFFLLPSLLVFLACALLLIHAVQTYGICMQQVQRGMELQRAWQLVQQSAAGKDDAQCSRQLRMTGAGVQILEVQGSYGKSKCTLVMAQE